MESESTQSSPHGQRRHFNQAHRRTSLFGSENEPQCFEEHTKNPVNGSYVLHNGMNNGRETLKIHQNHNLKDTSGVEHLIQAAKERARKRELDRYKVDEDSFLLETPEKPKSSKEHKRGMINAPWHTDPDEGIGSEKYQRRNGRIADEAPNVQRLKSRSQSITQQDFPRYSAQELKVSKYI
ncbi:unnamed protein product [Trichobilharzia regenti]|nr:unnamed protein product [Trichobilharzia regenti]